MSLQTLLDGLNEPSKEQFLYVQSVAETIMPKMVLEIGSGYGICASASLVGTNAKLVSVDPIVNLPQLEMRTKLVKVWDRITRHIGRSIDVLPKLEKCFDLIIVDGDHGYDTVYFDLETSLKLINKGGVILVDDFFHAHNWTNKYGIAKATSELAKKYGFSYTVNPAAHGIVRINT